MVIRHTIDQMWENTWDSRLRKRTYLGAYDDITETIFTSNYNLINDDHFFSHEYSHYLHLISTIYGANLRYLDHLRYSGANEFFAEIRHLPFIGLPLKNWLSDSKNMKKLPDKASNGLSVWHSMSKIRNALEGIQNYPIKDILSSTKIIYEVSEKTMTTLGFHNYNLNSNFPNDIESKEFGSKACPVWNNDQLGGIHILESLAWVCEFFHSRKIVFDKKGRLSVDDETFKVPIPYKRALFLFIKWVNPAQIRVFKDYEKTETELKISLTLLITFAIVAKIALMVPLCPPFFAICSKEITWFDVHPGWRFSRMAKTADMLLQLFRYSANSRSLNWFQNIENAICEVFKWPTYQDYLKNFEILADSSDTLMMDFFGRTITAIKENIDYPWSTLLPLSHTGKRPQICSEFPPNIIGTSAEKIILFPGWKAKSNYMLGEFISHMNSPHEKSILDSSTKLFVPFLKNKNIPKLDLPNQFVVFSYLISAWIDYVMSGSGSDLDIFIEKVFPLDCTHIFSWAKYMLNIGSMMRCFRELSQFVSIKTNTPIVSFVLPVEWWVPHVLAKPLAKIMKDKLNI